LGAARTLAALPPHCCACPRLHYRARRFERRLAALALGFFLGTALRSAAAERAVQMGIAEMEVSGLTGVLKTDPRRTASGQGAAYLELESVRGRGGLRASARGETAVFFPQAAFPRVKDLGRGSRMYVEGGFFTSKEGRKGFQAVSVHIMNSAPPFEQLRNRMRAGILQRLSEPPWGGLAQTLLLGSRDALDSELARAYQEAGCAHVLALSGLHLTVVSGFIAFLLKRPLGLKAAAAAGALFVFFYITLTGIQPSLERAAIMYFLGALAVFGALPRNTLTLLALSFLIQLTLRPAAGDSLSFILSYLALGGILTLGETLYRLMRGTIPDFLARPLAASLGAFIAAAPVLSASLGELRPIGVLAGLAVIPLSASFMIAAIVYLALCPLIPALAQPLGTAIAFLYTVLDRLVSAASAIPALQTAFPGAVLGAVLAFSALIGAFSRHVYRMRNRIDPFDNGY
jgi:competence protein ComEC